MTRYLVIEKSSINELEKAVNVRLEDGRRCLGGVATFFKSPFGYYLQAMVKGAIK